MELKYGKGTLSLDIPSDFKWRELRLPLRVPVQDSLLAVRQALMDPIGLPRLGEIVKPKESICILVNDSTRVARSEVFLPPLIAELTEAGIRKRDIFVVFAEGTHRPMTKAEMVQLVGTEVASEIPMYNHDCKAKDLVFLGETSRGTPVSVNRRVAEADRRVLTGSITHHYFAGFGGGRKALVPGVAGHETIRRNHSLMLCSQAGSGLLDGNPVHQDLLEAARLVGGDFLLNVVLNENMDFLGVFAGDMVEAHLEGCRVVRDSYEVSIDGLSDVVIVSCGGYPKDLNLYQAQKTLDNAVRAVRDGGHIILLAKSSEGTGSDEYERWVDRYPGFEQMEQALRLDFQLGGHKAYSIARALKRATVYLVSDLPHQKVTKLGFIPAASPGEALRMVTPMLEPGSNLTVIPQGSLTVPRPG